MYSILLSIVKVISDALTAGFGVLGLLSDFRDDQKRITRTGKIAIVGIAFGFILSATMTALEVLNSRAEERDHAVEIGRLSHPLGSWKAEMVFSIEPPDRNDKFLKGLRKLFVNMTGGFVDGEQLGAQLAKSKIAHGLTTRHFDDGSTKFEVEIDHKDLPSDLAFYAVNFDITGGLQIKLYHDGRPCSALDNSDGLGTPGDLTLKTRSIDLKSDLSTQWVFFVEDQSIRLKRVLNLDIEQSSGVLTSVDDLAGSTWVIWQTATSSAGFYPLYKITMTVAPGISEAVPISAFTQVSSAGTRGYCVTTTKQR